VGWGQESGSRDYGASTAVGSARPVAATVRSRLRRPVRHGAARRVKVQKLTAQADPGTGRFATDNRPIGCYVNPAGPFAA